MITGEVTLPCFVISLPEAKQVTKRTSVDIVNPVFRGGDNNVYWNSFRYLLSSGSEITKQGMVISPVVIDLFLSFYFGAERFPILHFLLPVLVTYPENQNVSWKNHADRMCRAPITRRFLIWVQTFVSEFFNYITGKKAKENPSSHLPCAIQIYHFSAIR